MKLVYFIMDVREEHQAKHKHIIIGINAHDLRNRVSGMSFRAENYEVAVYCNADTYDYIVARLVLGAFEVYDIHKTEMLDMHFYKEIVMF